MGLFSTDASVPWAVLSAGGLAARPCDSALGDLLADFSRSLGELSPTSPIGLQRCLARSGSGPEATRRGTGCSAVVSGQHRDAVARVTTKWESIWSTELDGRVADASSRTPRFWLATTTKALADRLSEGIQQEASVSQALISFLHLDGQGH